MRGACQQKSQLRITFYEGGGGVLESWGNVQARDGCYDMAQGTLASERPRSCIKIELGVD